MFLIINFDSPSTIKWWPYSPNFTESNEPRVVITSFPQEGRLNILRPDSNRGLKVIYVVSKAVHEWKRWFMCVVFFHLLISHHGGVFPLTVSKIGSNKITVKGKRRSTSFRQITNLVSVNNNFYHLYTSILSKYLKHKSLSLSQTDQKKENTFTSNPESTALVGFPTHIPTHEMSIFCHSPISLLSELLHGCQTLRTKFILYRR